MTRVVTLGGGHGQATLLRALARLSCEITAVVSVADDGGCSGRLRRDFGMPPPGDLRRCLTSLARDSTKAAVLEARDTERRCYGNLMIASLWKASRLDLQSASDAIAEWLDAAGRVCPVSNCPGTLVAETETGEPLEGECAIAKHRVCASSLRVRLPGGVNPAALQALRQADIVFLGAGSFLTSVLACILTPGIAEAVSESPAKKILISNLAPEDPDDCWLNPFAHVDLLQEHMARQTGKVLDGLVSLQDGQVRSLGEASSNALGGSLRSGVVMAPLADMSGLRHDPTKLATVIGEWLRIPTRFGLDTCQRFGAAH